MQDAICERCGKVQLKTKLWIYGIEDIEEPSLNYHLICPQCIRAIEYLIRGEIKYEN